MDISISGRGSVYDERNLDRSHHGSNVGIPGPASRRVPSRLAHYKMSFPGVFPRESNGKVEVEGAPDMEAFVRSILDRFVGWEKTLAGIKASSERLEFLRTNIMCNHIAWGMWIGQHPEDIDFVWAQVADEERPGSEIIPSRCEPPGSGGWRKWTGIQEEFTFEGRCDKPLDEYIGPRNEELPRCEIPAWLMEMNRAEERQIDEKNKGKDREEKREKDEGERRDSGASLVGRVFGKVRRVMSWEPDKTRK